MNRKILSIIMFALSGALMVIFAVKTVVDYAYYTHSANSAPFSVWIAANALYFVLPAAILACAAVFAARRSFNKRGK